MSEGAGLAEFFLNLRYGPVGQAVEVLVSTQDGTATAGSDYTAKSDELITIPQGNLWQSLPVDIIDDEDVEGGVPEDFTLNINSVTGARLGDNTAQCSIADNEPVPSVPPATGRPSGVPTPTGLPSPTPVPSG